jgi:hypothetical protein
MSKHIKTEDRKNTNFVTKISEIPSDYIPVKFIVDGDKKFRKKIINLLGQDKLNAYCTGKYTEMFIYKHICKENIERFIIKPIKPKVKVKNKKLTKEVVPEDRNFYRNLLLNLKKEQGQQFGKLDRIEALLRIILLNGGFDTDELTLLISEEIKIIRDRKKKE